MAGAKTGSAQGPARIVAVCASAGGLDSLERFFSNLASGGGFAYVVIQHHARSPKSALADILRDWTSVVVGSAAHGARIQRNHVYVAEPGFALEVAAGRFRSIARRGAGPPIDRFLLSLAMDAGPRSACIILSGAGSDGSRGAAAVSDAGGIVLVQDPATAGFDSMPRATLRSTQANFVLAPEHMPRVLGSLGRPVGRPTSPHAGAGREAEPLQAILEIVRARTSIDFARYRSSTIRRRLARRISMLGVPDLTAYLRVLEGDPPEAKRLVTAMLIGVSSFFRDPAVWTAVREKLVPRLVELADDGRPLRFWVPGCSTGEEAFTLAMIVRAARSRNSRPVPVQVFATDIDEDALQAARRGVFPIGVEADIPRAYLERFFVRGGGGLQVAAEIRDAVIFARHNVIDDPPFLRMDLVSCRNLLIYLDSGLQRRLLSIFHFALADDAPLILGSSESLGACSGLFSSVDSRNRLFSRLPGSASPAATLQLPAASMADGAAYPTVSSSRMELQSTSEELHATNEELETTKEELLAVNEEIESVNLELRGKVAALSRASCDLSNLLAGSLVAMIYLDTDLRIQRFTPSIRRFMPLRATDVGRPVTDITSQLDDDALFPDCRLAMSTLVSKECTVQSVDGRWFRRHVAPYRSADGAVEGALITFTDVTDLERMRSRVDFLTELLELRLGAVVVTDDAGRVEMVSEEFSKRTGLASTALVGQCVSRLRASGYPTAWFLAIRGAIRDRESAPRHWRKRRAAATGPPRESLSLLPVRGSAGKAAGYLVVLDDLSLADEPGSARRATRCASALLSVLDAAYHDRAAPRSALRATCRALIRSGVCVSAWAAELSPDSGRLRLPAFRAGRWPASAGGLGPPRARHALRAGPVAEALARRAPLLVRARSDARGATRRRAAGQSTAVIPIVNRAHACGVLVATSPDAAAFGAPELEVLAAIASTLASFFVRGRRGGRA